MSASAWPLRSLVFGGGMQLLAPQPNTAGFVRVLGGFVGVAGAVMIAAEVGDFRSWTDRIGPGRALVVVVMQLDTGKGGRVQRLG